MDLTNLIEIQNEKRERCDELERSMRIPIMALNRATEDLMIQSLIGLLQDDTENVLHQLYGAAIDRRPEASSTISIYAHNCGQAVESYINRVGREYLEQKELI